MGALATTGALSKVPEFDEFKDESNADGDDDRRASYELGPTSRTLLPMLRPDRPESSRGLELHPTTTTKETERTRKRIESDMLCNLRVTMDKDEVPAHRRLDLFEYRLKTPVIKREGGLMSFLRVRLKK